MTTKAQVHVIHLEPLPYKSGVPITRHCSCGWAGKQGESHPKMSLEDAILSIGPRPKHYGQHVQGCISCYNFTEENK